MKLCAEILIMLYLTFSSSFKANLWYQKHGTNSISFIEVYCVKLTTVLKVWHHFCLMDKSFIRTQVHAQCSYIWMIFNVEHSIIQLEAIGFESFFHKSCSICMATFSRSSLTFSVTELKMFVTLGILCNASNIGNKVIIYYWIFICWNHRIPISHMVWKCCTN